MRRKEIVRVMAMAAVVAILAGCGGKRQDAYNNERMTVQESGSDQEEQQAAQGDEIDSDEQEQQPWEVTLQDDTAKDDSSGEKDEILENAVIKGNSTYNCDIKADQDTWDGQVDITVGDNYYATQINDWYMYFDQYEGQVVEIEGYYVNEFAPYDFIGRYGPSCPYCQGGYVSSEILTDEDMSSYANASDWIKVTGILRQGMDVQKGPFYYIEALKLEKMPEVGVDTVTN